MTEQSQDVASMKPAQSSSPVDAAHSQAQAEWNGNLPEYETYASVLDDLYRWRERQSKFIPSANGHYRKENLENISAVAAALGDPQSSYKVVHVAGTNGKGSVCLKTAAALQSAGLKVGLFTSPHISCFRERILINGSMISEQEVVTYSNQVMRAQVTLQTPLTFFDVSALMAFLYFKDRQCDVAVVEVGMGGTIDSTNIVQPYICGITSISMDHVGILGNTLDEIAAQKGGIIKQGVEVVVGEGAPHHVFEPIAQAHSAPYIVVAGTVGVTFKQQNEGIAKELVQRVLGKLGRQDALPEALACIPDANQSCRMQQVSMNQGRLTVYIDVAHNEEGVQVVLNEIKQKHPGKSIRVACSFSKMKEIQTMIEMLLSQVKTVHFVASPHFKLESIDSLYAMAEAYAAQRQEKSGGGALAPLIENGNIESTLNHATQMSDEDGAEEVLLVCGSFFIMEGVRNYFFPGRYESDPAFLNSS